MPFPLAAADIVRTSIIGSLAGQRVMTLLTWGVKEVTGTPSQEDALGALTDALTTGDGLVDAYRALVPTNYTLTEIWQQVISPGRYQRFRAAFALAGLGEGVSTSPNVACVITRRGERGTRSNVSNVHVPIPTITAAVESGILKTAVLDQMTALGIKLKTEVTTTGVVATYTPIIFNGPDSEDVTVIASTFNNPYSRTMRRRTVGLGE